jgi:hypothetical protein
MTVGLVGLLLAIGWAIAEGQTKLFVLVGAAGAMCALAITRRGAFIGVLLLAAMNGIPYLDTSRTLASKYTFEDAAVFVLLLVAAAWILAGRGEYRPSRAGRAISRAGVVLLLWWLFTVGRTVAGHDVSLTHAASFGRDFAFFAALLALLPRVRLQERDIGALLCVLLAGVVLFATGQVMTALGVGQPGSLIHFRYTLAESGVTRVYASMTDLVTAGVALSVAACLLARRTAVRLVAAPVAILLSTSTVVQLTRARWVGLLVGLLVVTLWFLFNDNTPLSATLRRRSALFLGALAFAVVAVVVAAPGIFSSGTVIHRLLSIFSDLQGSGSVETRERVTKTMTSILGEKWLAGLGFLPPSAHYFQGLPEGSIRDSDVGVLNAVMTMGVLGAALVYVPVVTMLGSCLRRVSSNVATPYGWLRFGGAIWITGTLVSSVTLVTLFSPTGLTLVGVLLALLSNRSVLAGEGAALPDQSSAGAWRTASQGRAVTLTPSRRRARTASIRFHRTRLDPDAIAPPVTPSGGTSSTPNTMLASRPTAIPPTAARS